MASVSHLAKRFAGSLVPVGPAPSDVQWALGWLNAGEAELWQRMDRADRRHSVAVARRVSAAMGPGATRPVLAAALLHDVGKVVSGLGPYRRAAATVVVKAAGPDRVVAWGGGDGVGRRIGLYADHPRLGRALLAQAGSDPLTADWAGEHHLPESQWTTPRPIGDALKAADDD